jgi:hypothetical protein
MSRIVGILTIGLWLTLLLALPADEKNRREESVRGDKDRFSSMERWMYNDVEAGFELGKQNNKPVLVVLRCVPCKACTGIDERVLKARELQPLLDQFVCVRVINANDLDLSRFQFDYDLSFSTMFFNADGTVYGRFGSWQHQLDEMDTTIDGFQVALERALEVHRNYPDAADTLKTKQGVPTPFSVPVEIPGLAGKYERTLNWDGNVVQSCVHCHQIGEAYRAWYRERQQPIPSELIYPMPEPKTIGLKLDGRSPSRILAVDPKSIAFRAGLQAKDEIVSIDDAPIFSVADVAWALHRCSDPGSMKCLILRDGAVREVPIELPDGWRFETNIAPRVGTWQLRGMALGGLVLKELGAAKRRELQLGNSDLGLVVDHVGEYGVHAAAKKAGFQKGDVLLSLEGFSAPIHESRLIGEILTRFPNPTKLATQVLRGNQRVSLELPVQ